MHLNTITNSVILKSDDLHQLQHDSSRNNNDKTSEEDESSPTEANSIIVAESETTSGEPYVCVNAEVDKENSGFILRIYTTPDQPFQEWLVDMGDGNCDTDGTLPQQLNKLYSFPLENVENIQTGEQNIAPTEILMINDACVHEQTFQIDTDQQIQDNSKDNNDQITHIEIIRPRTGARKVTGANRVVPLLTNVWSNRKQSVKECTLSSVYKAILENIDGRDDCKCEICGGEFLSATHLAHHVRITYDLPVKLQQCFVCGKKYAFEQRLMEHLSTLHRISYPQLMCKICFMEFSTPIEQKAHERKHDKNFICIVCFKRFESEFFLQEHHEEEHLVYMKPFECQKCGTRFKNKTVHNIHEQRHLNLSCNVCGILFLDDLDLLKHIKTHSAGDEKAFINHIEELDKHESELQDLTQIYTKLQSHGVVSTHNSLGSSNKVQKAVANCVGDMVYSVSEFLQLNEEESSSTEPSNKDAIQCKLCSLEFSSIENLIAHRRKSHLRNRTCPLCRKRCHSVSQTWRHIATHMKKKQMHSSVKAHVKDKTDSNNTKSNNVCEICKESFTTSAECFCHLQCHLASEQNNSVVCEICKKVFPTRGKRNSHMETVHKIEVISRPYSCGICARKFQLKTARDRHLMLHSKDKVGCWKCPTCSQVFLRPKFLIRHLEEHDLSHTCSICNKSFTKRSKLRLHLKSHEPAEIRKRYHCKYCPTRCDTSSGLQVHLRIHTGERPYKCEVCHKGFKRLQALKKHKNNVHKGPNSVSHPCSFCSVAFNDRGNLIRHILRVHQGLKRFICGICGGKYGQNQDLRRHLRLKHSVIIPQITGREKKGVNEIYVLPPFSNLPEDHPHALKINAIVEEEKKKFEAATDILMKTNSLPAALKMQKNLQPPPSVNALIEKEIANIKLAEKNMSVDTSNKATEFNNSANVLSVPITVFDNVQNHVKYSGNKSVNSDLIAEYVCEMCNVKFVSSTDYVAHVQRQGEMICKECKVNFCNEELFQKHLQEHNNNVILKCNSCFFECCDKRQIQEHMLVTHGIRLHAESVENGQMVERGKPKQFIPILKTSTIPQASVPNQGMILFSTVDTNCSAQYNASTQDMNQFIDASMGVVTAGTLPKNTLPQETPATGNNITVPTIISKPSISLLANGTGTGDMLLRNVLLDSTNQPVTVSFNNQSTLLANNSQNPVLTFQSPIIHSVYSNDSQGSTLTLTSDGNDALVNMQNPSVQCAVNSGQVPLPQQPAVFSSNVMQLQTMDFNLYNGGMGSSSHDACGEDVQMNGIHQENHPEVFHQESQSCAVKQNYRAQAKVSKKNTSKEGASGLTCRYCDKSFNNNTQLERHAKIHFGIKPFECSQCGKHFLEKHNLKVHMRSHTGERPYQCEECGQSVRYQKELVDHKRKHAGEKPYLCDICGRRFLRHREVIRHKAIHSDVKKYACPVCAKRFTRLDHLKRVHMLKHKDKTEKDKNAYLCDICNKKFSSQASLQHHKVLHSGKKEHVCIICGKAFALHSYLKAHVATHRKRENYIPCPKCKRKFSTLENLKVHSKFHNKSDNKVICKGKRSARSKKKKKDDDAETEEERYVEESNSVFEIRNIELAPHELEEAENAGRVIFLHVISNDVAGVGNSSLVISDDIASSPNADQ